jgi:hypothetical protein
MAVIPIRRGLMPGFTELAADMTLAGVVGTEAFGALIRLCVIAEPALDVPGSWVVAFSRADLAAYLGYSANKTKELLAHLVDAQLLVREPGTRLGRGMGATTDRYFIAAVPGLVTPTPLPRGTHTRSRNTPVTDSPVISRPVKAAPAQPGVPSRAPAYASTGPTHVSDLTDENSSHESDPDRSPASTSTLLTAALARVGWTGPLPLTGDVALVAATATWLAGQTGIANKAAYLNKLITNGDLVKFAAERGIAAGPSPEHAGLSSAAWVQAKNAHPHWAAPVHDRAAAVAAERGVAVRLALLCEVAASIAIPDDSQARQA